MPQNLDNGAYGSAELIRELLNRGPLHRGLFDDKMYPAKDPLAQSPGSKLVTGDMPPVPPAPMFRPDTNAGPDPNVANMLEQIYKTAPNLRGRIPRVQIGPDTTAINIMGDSKTPLKPHEYEDSTLMGTHLRDTHEISMNPYALSKDAPLVNQGWRVAMRDPNYPPIYDAEQILLHELGHSQGYGDTYPEMKQLEEIGNAIELYDPNRTWQSHKPQTTLKDILMGRTYGQER